MTAHRTLTALALSLAIVLSSVAAGAQARSRSSSNDADQKELLDYALSIEKIQKLGSVLKKFDEMSAQHPELRSGDSGGSISETTAKIQKYPEAVAVLTKNGLTPREYVVGSMTLIQAGMAVGFKRAGTYKEYPPEMLTIVSRPNLTFVEQHFDEITKIVPVLGQQ
jgi:hypothetical protein